MTATNREFLDAITAYHGCRGPFLAEIIANPDEDAPRLVYADWLQENGDPLAEFIRVQCAIVNGDNRIGLRDKEYELLESHASDWLSIHKGVNASPYENGKRDRTTVEYRVSGFGVLTAFQRGFLHRVGLTAEQFCGRVCSACEFRARSVQFRINAARTPCGVCHGSGRIGGIAGKLFAACPTIREVHLTDLTPSGGFGVPRAWWRLSERPSRHHVHEHLPGDVPDDLYELIDVPERRTFNRRRRKRFEIERDALDALAAACLQLGRAEAVRLIREKLKEPSHATV